jgi:hypothetical protein
MAIRPAGRLMGLALRLLALGKVPLILPDAFA